jgi:phosphate transport system permease protein
MDWRYFRRRTVNIVSLSGSVLATAFGLFWLFWILWTTFSYGFRHSTWACFSKYAGAGAPADSPRDRRQSHHGRPGRRDQHADRHTRGTCLAEYGGRTFVASVIRFINDILIRALNHHRTVRL